METISSQLIQICAQSTSHLQIADIADHDASLRNAALADHDTSLFSAALADIKHLDITDNVDVEEIGEPFVTSGSTRVYKARLSRDTEKHQACEVAVKRYISSYVSRDTIFNAQ